MYLKSFILIWFVAFPAALSAQTATFENVKEQSIKIQDVPTLNESIVPKTLSEKSTLPKVPKLEDLQNARDLVAQNVVLVYARQKSVSKLQRSGTLVTGHAVWVKTNGRVVLVSAGHWLEHASDIFVDPQPRPVDALTAETRTLAGLTYGSDRTVKKLKDGKLARLTVQTFDKHRNVAILVPADNHNLKTPVGLTLFPIDDEVAARTYGFSPLLGAVLVQTLFRGNDKNLAISYYLQSDFPALLGAPIVDSDGRLLALTAFAHPDSPERTLVIPPVALRVFLDKVTSAP